MGRIRGSGGASGNPESKRRSKLRLRLRTRKMFAELVTWAAHTSSADAGRFTLIRHTTAEADQVKVRANFGRGLVDFGGRTSGAELDRNS